MGYKFLGQMRFINELAYNQARYMSENNAAYCVYFLGMDTFGVVWC